MLLEIKGSGKIHKKSSIIITEMYTMSARWNHVICANWRQLMHTTWLHFQVCMRHRSTMLGARVRQLLLSRGACRDLICVLEWDAWEPHALVLDRAACWLEETRWDAEGDTGATCVTSLAVDLDFPHGTGNRSHVTEAALKVLDWNTPVRLGFLDARRIEVDLQSWWSVRDRTSSTS